MKGLVLFSVLILLILLWVSGAEKESGTDGRQSGSLSGSKVQQESGTDGRQPESLSGSKVQQATEYIEKDGMIFIPAGTFIMGYPGMEDRLYPKHEGGAGEVRLDGYWIDKYPHPNREGEYPTVLVNFYEAEALCGEAGKRLCTEEEWEKACKGPRNYLYPYGNKYDPDKCSTDKTEPSERKLARIGDYPECVSGYGVYGMSGNINELTSSRLTREEVIRGEGQSSFGHIPGWPDDLAEDGYQIHRGGDWGYSFDASCVPRNHYHGRYNKMHDDGFRCCRSRRN